MQLPEYLQERARWLENGTDLRGDFVVYWMRTALRADENPALDAARLISHERGLPLLVYHALSEHYKYASDRHHTFILQAARDVQRQLGQEGIDYAFYLATPKDRGAHLVTLADQAALVVTEEMPVDPPRRFLNRLAQQTSTPILCVDTACIVPMQMTKKAMTRAFKFRSATKKKYEERLSRTWPVVDIETKRFDQELPFDPINLQSANISELVSRCEIDHSIGPVVDTVGGTHAGYARWNQFKSQKLNRYAKTRNNPLIDGVSRMSAYLHYGMVSPLRLAREADLLDNEGAEKFLDELLIWRELAYAFCFHRSDHDQWSAIPDWAQETLQRHITDPRERVYTWEELARAKTNDPLWNAAQTSLIMHGELHNNVRMTWGKAILNWTRSPQVALELMIDLNHRYALDGRDPASYGGLLWCLGQFDRPFEPEKPVIGTVRPRPTEIHAQRLDPDKYLAKVAKPRFSPAPSVAIVGAGMSGLIAARTLMDHGLSVTVFEKSRGTGGRMATRRTETVGTFDHGAQYFTARDRRFRNLVDSWVESGIVAAWPNPNRSDEQKIVSLKEGQVLSESQSTERWVGTPGMNSICKHIAADLPIQTDTLIGRLRQSDASIELFDNQDQSVGKFNYVALAIPAAQAAALLKPEFDTLAEQIASIEMKPCWAAMVSLEDSLTQKWVGAFLDDSFLSWVSRNSSKPGRDSPTENLIIHATPQWTIENLESDRDRVAHLMLTEFWRVAGIAPQIPVHLKAHRWRYSIPAEPSDKLYHADDSLTVFTCGDWTSRPRVEGAFLSGMAMAGRILGTLSPIESQGENQGVLFS